MPCGLILPAIGYRRVGRHACASRLDRASEAGGRERASKFNRSEDRSRLWRSWLYILSVALSVKFSSSRPKESSLVVRGKAYVRHVLQKVVGLTVGAVFVSRFGRALRRKWPAGGDRATWPGLKVAIVAHVYYPELIGEILACREILPEGTPLFITAPPDRIAAARAGTAGRRHVYIHEHENRGRDILPFLMLLSSGALDGYDAVLKLHTKRSPHLLDGEIRRKLLFDKLCGNWNATCRFLTAFADASTGIVGWGQCWRATRSYWMANEALVRELAGLMQAPDAATRLGFFEGTMFWFRPAAFAALRELKLQPEDFEPEARQLDGTVHHAVERCFTIAAWSRGFTVRDLRGHTL